MTQKAKKNLSSTQIEDIVGVLYRGFLGRNAEQAGLQYWASRLHSGEAASLVLADFLESPECVAKAALRRHDQGIVAKLAALVERAVDSLPVTIVDVGAQSLKGEDHVYARLASLIESRVIGFEPLEHRRLERETKESRSELSMRAAFIGDGQEHFFHINSPDSASSLMPINTNVTAELAGFDQLRTVSRTRASTITLDEALSDVRQVDFLKLDIQGFEQRALISAPATLSRTLVVHCEVEFVPIYEEQPLFSDVDALLRENGFRFLDFSHLDRHAFRHGPSVEARDQLVWGDAVYFKERNLLSNPRDLLIQSLIALAVYRKPSLAQLLIHEHDLRAGSSHESIFGV